MASSRASSPAVSVSGTTSPVPLTPNSKVKALLASLDKDSDDDSISGSPRRRLMTSIVKDTTIRPRKSSEDAVSASKPDSDSEEEVIRPKGRMAARMQAIGSGSDRTGPSSDETPRERARKILKAKSKSPSPTSNTQDGAGSDGSDGSDIPVVSRKRKVRVPRRATPASSPEKGPASPGLFVSPSTRRSAPPAGGDSDSDSLPQVKDTASNKRFLALVEKKREERIAKEAVVAKEKAANAEERKRQRALMAEDDNIDDDDEEVERRLTQRAPIRKASKKALEEMHRETQRLSRNQQLAHNATTKKKYTRSGLLALFNYNMEKGQPSEQEHAASSSPPDPKSDMETRDTPPTSPASHKDAVEETIVERETTVFNADKEISSVDELRHIPSSPPQKLDKGKGKAVEEVVPEAPAVQKPLFVQRPIRIRPPKPADRQIYTADDSDSDLEIVVTKTTALKKKMDIIFDRVPAKQGREAQSIHALRMLANVTSPGKQTVSRNKKPSITTSELQVSLQQKARQQATLAREEKLQALRARGVIIQTTEEREKEMAEVDDLLARARQEGEEIMKREKAAAKKERRAAGDADPLGESSDDEDWEESKAAAEEVASGSGSENDEEGSENDASDESEEEDVEEDAMEVDEAENATLNPMFDEEAGETDDDEDVPELPVVEEMAEASDLEEEEQMLPTRNHRRARKSNVIPDDGDSGDEIAVNQTPRAPQNISPVIHNDSPVAPNSVLRSATKTFIPGLPVVGVAGLGLTQIFAGTMDESQSDVFEGFPTSPAPTFQEESNRNDSMAFLKRLPAPELPPFVATLEEGTQDLEMMSPSQDVHIPESQPAESMTQGINFNFSQSQYHGFDSLVEGTQMSPFPDATQDVGFQHMTPIKGRFVDAPPSTVDTLVLASTALPVAVVESPIVKKKGKLHRRAPVVNFSDDEEIETSNIGVGDDNLEISTNVFDAMRKASKKKVVVNEFDKKKSDAKQMVHEQAEESEDEYAGLGGASDDESGGEADAFVKEMIDDEAGKDADERELAAFFADRERASDEKQVEKLYNDITKGMLRRKRGADYDLSDSDDGGEARQRRKRKEFAKMRKALLADERIGKIAENPKKLAFLRAIEDRGSEDEMDFLEDFADQDETTDSQSQNEGPEVIPNSQPTEMGPPKRKLSEDTISADARAPPHLRRTKMGKKPSNLSEIRESLSSLIEEPNAVTATEDSESEEELEIVEGEDLGSAPVRNKENRDPFALRRTNVAIIDRITLKRQSSSSISNSTRLAFSATSAAPGFKVPALLRRATTNSSITSSTSNSGASSTERMAGSTGGDGVKRGGGKNSGVNYFARESERRAAVVKTEKRREKKLVKGAQIRRKVVGGLLGGGKFE